ncbi:ALPL [Bugula neritina]|uniref:Alkaline phosphatase, tissue-nonspecific isozyme n=1 Tax=Bugula neritina TaxID=10212 RepID=A0A7J7JGN2_BUGNE|nr:ALPL [Bugula neritina]
MTSSDDTLVVVSADHSHAFSFGGYSHRGQSILSIANQSYYDSTDSNGHYYTVVSYGNGPGHKSVPQNYTDEYFDVDRVYESVFPLDSETHGGEDVQIFASGPMSHLFTGTHEQTYIAHAMAYAACIGQNKAHCSTRRDTTTPLPTYQLPPTQPAVII